MRPLDPRFDDDGLVVGVVQDAATGRVLMVGYLNAEALAATLATRRVHFWSRSRNELWEKGETSGNTLALEGIALDCDGDAILISARPAGPTCHAGTVSCFDDPESPPPAAAGFFALEELWATISDRAAARPEGSYTARLVAGGVDATARKVFEEAGEVVLAAKDHAAGTGGADRLAGESADLVYHLLALLAERGLDPAEVMGVLEARRRK